jgi:hypothetical protein
MSVGNYLQVRQASAACLRPRDPPQTLQGVRHSDPFPRTRVRAHVCSQAGGWRKLHDEELRDLYSSPSIITMKIGGACGTNGRNACRF